MPIEPKQIKDPLTVKFNSTFVDNSSRLRVSVTNPQVVVKHDGATLYKSLSSFTQNAGATDLDVNSITNGSTQLSISSSPNPSGGFARLKSNECGVFATGTGLLVLLVSSFNNAGAIDITKELGYANSGGGIFLRQLNDAISLELSSSTIASRSIASSSWDDQSFFDSGSSNYINFSGGVTFTFFIALQHTNIGDIKCGFFIGDEYKVAHTIKNQPVLTTKPYLRSLNNYLVWQMSRPTNNTTASSMTAISGAVLQEGSPKVYNTNLSCARRVSGYSNGGSGADVGKVIAQFRLNPSYPTARVFLTKMVLYMSSTATGYIEVYKNVVLSSGSLTPTWKDVGSSPVQWYEPPTATNTASVSNDISSVSSSTYHLTYADVINNAAASGPAIFLVGQSVQLHTNANYVSDIYSVVVNVTTINETVSQFVMYFTEEV